MDVSVEIELWSKPSWMMEIEGKNKIDTKILRNMGEWFNKHLDNISSIIDILQKNKWEMHECYGAIYSLIFSKDGINTKKEAMDDLRKIGINPKEVMVIEYEE